MPKRPPKKTEPQALQIRGDDAVLAAVREWLAMFAPRPKPKLSEFMLEHACDDTGASITPFPFQLEMADAFTDPETAQLSCRKSSRIGYSTILQSFMAYRIRYDPARSLIYQPTIDDAEKYSRDDLEPVLQWDIVREVATFKPRHADNQIRAKRYKGGWIQIKGANSPKEFRRVTADDVFLEECDGYPWATKEEGDPARLAYKRNLTSPRRFSAAGSTPKVKGFSRIDLLFEQGSQEFRYVPCPHCGEMQQLVFGDGTGAGIRWEPKENPTRAWYRCVNGCDIDEADKAAMDEAGEWRAHNPAAFPRHRSFHIWAAYSQHPGAAWLEIAREFMEVRKDPNLLRTFVNQVLGEAWAERGEAPEWQRLYDRREKAMRLGTPSAKAGLLVGAADVQRGGGGRIDLDIWAFGQNGRREFVERIEVFGSISDKATWAKLDAEVSRTWTSEDGRIMRLARVAIDSGDGENTMEVYAWARRHPGFVMAVKGRHMITANQPIGSPTWQDVTVNGRKMKRGVRLWNIGTSMLKLELFGDLEKEKPVDGEEYPDGYVYLPDGTTDEWIKQLVAEELRIIRQRNGGFRREWHKNRDRNEALDNAVYARAVAFSLGVDRWTPAQWALLLEKPAEERVAKPAGKKAAPAKLAPVAPKKPPPPKPPSNWMNRRRR
ncbi:phage terminase large subunit family protein [Sphingomonas desiccabilis]|uniref:Terminase n=1 Tax=Sphingomonas desiccabilis TaxID=429134 RepID=A0A4Q2J156_9SPHN|nr:terminase gpA endonuclease subunit [Sphingomonas desiccabilis]MBB3910848.1 phage terminase large subunit GpA-like protein [Sphingomonas desiccabilis]RXZ35453.1 terminase [Sphingomonas desiccabilis]